MKLKHFCFNYCDLIEYLPDGELSIANLFDIEIKLGLTNSPFRVDKNPSFYTYLNKNNVLRFLDYGTNVCNGLVFHIAKLKNIKVYDVLKAVSEAYHVDIFTDFSFIEISKVNNVKFEKANTKIKISNTNKKNTNINFLFKKDFSEKDLLFWSKYNIDKKTLNKFNVKPLEFIIYDENPVYVGQNLSFYYGLNNKSWKVYQPYSYRKWLSHVTENVIEGFDQLNYNKKDYLILTKSYKDVMSLHTIKVSAVALHSEVYNPPENHLIFDVLKRFKKVYVLYDNDTTGKERSLYWASKGLIPIFMKSAKDFSDVSSLKGIKFAAKELKSILNSIPSYENQV